ncbi:hypothetical protein V2A60_006965 [Cordyceps javanica]|uniref:Uncharacterized protein n=1 Tax=Cordyceps javanica TaxID=43265 RepID=A0A545US51_9HYPO|nr:hypothetical protein IF1G_08793 [Cordyceps javanica]TQW04480.1 hypothetical protein IF2G_08250 [Cordyceps javanica]
MSSNQLTVIHNFIRFSREYIEYSDGSKWTRKVDPESGKPTSDWTAVEAPVSEVEEGSRLQLIVVAQRQADNEPKHWSIFCHRPNSSGTGKGTVWQVKGDAEYMHYQHTLNTDILNSRSFEWHQVVNNNLNESQLARVEQICNSEPPPRAANRASVTENCQGWVIRVLYRLAKEGIVQQNAIAVLQRYMDPIN